MPERRGFDVAVVGLGGIGSSAAYHASKRVGSGVLGLERFELGHERGASQDHSRLIRLSYHTPAYVRFARDAFAAWAELEDRSGEHLIVRTGGIDLYPPTAWDWADDYTRSLDEVGVEHEWIDAAETMRRWPQWRLSEDVRVMYQANTGVLAAARANAAHRRLAERAGATLLAGARLAEIREAGGLYELETEAGTFRAERVILTADAWTNELLEQLWRPIDLTVTQEQVHYYASRDAEAFAPERFPVWIWMGVPSFYGLPVFGEPGAKIGQDVGGRQVTGDSRSFDPDPEYSARLDGFMREHLPDGFGPYRARKTCLYTMTPDRDFVLDRVPGHELAVVGQGAAHAMKFASVFGRSLVELVFDGRAQSDISAWSIDREILTMPDPPRSFLV
jgi:sarcosine oxidase